jgi:hypothetical protein
MSKYLAAPEVSFNVAVLQEVLCVLPMSGDGMPSSRVWLCGSVRDNMRYANTYDVSCIDQ